MPIKKDKGPRSSISAEAFGTFNKKENFKPIIIPKKWLGQIENKKYSRKIFYVFKFGWKWKKYYCRCYARKKNRKKGRCSN